MLFAAAGAWMLVKVGVVLLALLVGLALLNRRLSPGPPSAARASLRLTPQHGVHVLELEGRRLLIGTGPTGPPRLICELGVDAGARERAHARLDER